MEIWITLPGRHRNISDTIYVISIPQTNMVKNKKSSVTFTDLDNEIIYSDNNRGSSCINNSTL